MLEMLEAGAAGYLVKGSSIDAIVRSITEAAAGRSSLSAEVTGKVIEELVGELTNRRRVRDRRWQRETRVRRALTEAGVLNVVFQPICTLAGTIVGAEALARFRGPPDYGPDRWFLEAGEVGLRGELEVAAARMALDALPSLPDHVYLTVNMSPEVLADSAFVQLLRDVDAERVVVEVTEHARIDDYDVFNDALRHLRLLGTRIAVDDAGAGFSSLQHILRLGPDFIKLDRTLVDGIARDRPMQALTAGLMSFADKIEATIIAEGIERADELDALVELGVSYGQGYYLAMPAPLLLVSSLGGHAPAVASAVCE